jgi:hypothetical protein
VVGRRGGLACRSFPVQSGTPEESMGPGLLGECDSQRACRLTLCARSFFKHKNWLQSTKLCAYHNYSVKTSKLPILLYSTSSASYVL